MVGPIADTRKQRGGAIVPPLYFYERNDLFMSYKPLENVTIVFSTANITVCADEWGDLYYTTEIPDEFVNQGEPYLKPTVSLLCLEKRSELSPVTPEKATLQPATKSCLRHSQK